MSGSMMLADGGEVEKKRSRFSLLKDLLKRHKKANSEVKASNDPMKFIRDNRNPSIKGLKGVAF